MSREQELIDKVARLREDFASLGDGPFEHFYCPTLLVDEYAELCLGHVVNEAISNSSRITVPQRKDIDNLYGTLCESCFGPFLKAHALGTDAHTILSDPEIRRQLPWTVSLNRKAIDCYEYRGNKHPLHPTVEFRDRNGKIFTVALKTTDQLDNAGQFQIVSTETTRRK